MGRRDPYDPVTLMTLKLNQIERIERLTDGEVPPAVHLHLRFASTVRGVVVLERVRQVMQLVAIAQSQTWPSDDEWRCRLPDWFIRTFEGYTREELLMRPDLWDFGSWLDAMKLPGWEWWSCRSNDHGGTVRAVAYSDPFAIDPLIYLLRVSGGSDIAFDEE